MHPNAQYWIGNYFFAILFTFYWYFMVKLLSFLFSTTFFFNKFYSFVAQKILWQTLVQSSVAKRISEHKNRKKSTKYYQISKQMIRVDEYDAFLTKRFDWGTKTSIYHYDAMWPSPSLSQFSAWSENIYGKHHCQILHQSINQLLNNPFVMWITRNCVTCNL